MILELTNSDFHDLFRSAGRHEWFSAEALNALFNWYNEVMGGDWPVEVTSICSEWTEYRSVEDLLEDYGVDVIEDLDYAIEPDYVIELESGNILVLHLVDFYDR